MKDGINKGNIWSITSDYYIPIRIIWNYNSYNYVYAIGTYDKYTNKLGI